MGNCVSSADDRVNQARSDAIEKQLKEDGKKFKKECKILLLGCGESGKSTIVKQMKIIHQTGFNEEELVTYRSFVYTNVLDSAQALVGAMRTIGFSCMNAENEALRHKILDFRIDPALTFALTDGIAQAIHQLWQDPIIAKIMDEHSTEFYLMDSASYFFSEVLRIGASDYIPTQTDVLRARMKSTGITETRFYMGQLSIHMVDVGYQLERSERKKFMHCFESVTSIIFCTALSEYDQTMFDDHWKYRHPGMRESLALFESVINSRWFLGKPIILFLNKIDVFKNKLPKIPLEWYHSEYTGGDDANKAAKYILQRFMQTNRARLSVYPYLTQATDTSSVRSVFADVKETILQCALKDSSIL